MELTLAYLLGFLLYAGACLLFVGLCFGLPFWVMGRWLARANGTKTGLTLRMVCGVVGCAAGVPLLVWLGIGFLLRQQPSGGNGLGLLGPLLGSVLLSALGGLTGALFGLARRGTSPQARTRPKEDTFTYVFLLVAGLAIVAFGGWKLFLTAKVY